MLWLLSGRIMNSDYCWRVYINERVGIMPVEMLFYASRSLPDALRYLASREHLNTKKRRVYLKRLGSKIRYDSKRPPVEYEDEPDEQLRLHD